MHNPYAQEAQQRWGNTEAYKVSAARTASYTEADWARHSSEQSANVAAFVAAMTAGCAADSAEAVAAAKEHRRLIDDWFYPCDEQMQCRLADMYIADERFTAFYDQHASGLAKYVHDAIYSAALT